MHWAKFKTALLALIVAAGTSCSRQKSSDTYGPPVPAGSLMRTNIRFGFAIYYLPVPKTNPATALGKLLKDRFTNIQQVAELNATTSGISLFSKVDTDAKTNYPPPDLESLKYFGRGLTREQAVALQSSTTLCILAFDYPSNHIWSGMHSALQLTDALARQTGGIIWDTDTREAFTVDEWHFRRLKSWPVASAPNLADHTTIHAYNKGEFARAITLGMGKFGIPDIVINDFSWSLNRNIGHLINLFAQSIVEGAVVTKPGEFDLDLRAIKNAEVRDPQLAALKQKGTGKAKLTLHQGTPEEGDPENRLIEIGFSRYQGRDVHARQTKLLMTMFGWEDSISPARHDEEIRAASQRAREKLPGLQAAFKKGLAPGEYIQVKAPFSAPGGGSEYMWVEITAWEGSRIKGLLKNEPRYIPNLHGGQIVEVDQSKVFDYYRTFPDGRTEGNETAALIERQNKSR